MPVELRKQAAYVRHVGGMPVRGDAAAVAACLLARVSLHGQRAHIDDSLLRTSSQDIARSENQREQSLDVVVLNATPAKAAHRRPGKLGQLEFFVKTLRSHLC